MGREDYTQSKMSYDLRRLRLKGIIFKLGGHNRYVLTSYGRKVALFFTKVNSRLFHTGFSIVTSEEEVPHPLRQALAKVNREIGALCKKAKMGLTA